jgi:1,4-alpha-glucan branching enzyme
MALEEPRAGTYLEFARHILPKIQHAGYNTIQLMAVMEHPYYGSFGYHVSSFFAPSSRFGTPDELKFLIDTAHGMGIRVLMDMVHSHSVKNEVEGLSKFDGSLYQFFHNGERGHHRLWDSRCFDYSKLEVQKFLLSNLRYWVEEFRVDGFRFDGITSMLFVDHGVARAFTRYDDYYGPDVDTDALSYLFMANALVHQINPAAITIAEDVSGYPGLAAPQNKGGIGFDYRFSMGLADFWIKLLKEYRDEQWPLGRLWYELTTHRREERTVSYAECHDQALVGDKTIMMHLMGKHIYNAMDKTNKSVETVRAVALHKMIRLITLATAHSGYLNFMGNEFGHPEWVDFPSERNHFSYSHARRQWSLKYNKSLYFSDLFEFDRQMVSLCRQMRLFSSGDTCLLNIHEDDKILVFERGGLIFAFNFHPVKSFSDYPVSAHPGKYRMILDTDEKRFGGPGRLNARQLHFTRTQKEGHTLCSSLSLYLPSRCALVLEPGHP